MCDLFVAMPDATADGRILFGKNSDRPAGECQVLFSGEARKASSTAQIKCSYLTLPDDHDTLATLGCRPYWCWGYETGINEAGVVGGNAALFTKSLHLPETRAELGLTGMDLLRLGLERGHSAEKAVEIIIVMLEKYGQWGSAVRGADHDTGSYDNSFLIADAKEAWVLETSGRRWAAERIDSGERSISNEPTIRTGWTKASADLCDFAAHQGWWQPQAGDFDFAYAYGDHVHYSRQVSHIRWQQTSQLLKQNRGRLTATTFMRFLRDHYEDTFLKGPQFHPYLPDFLTVCMHDSPNKFTWGNTATSVVAELDPSGKRPLVFWTAYLPPCTSIYTAFSVSSTLPHEVTKVGTTGVQVHQPLTAPVDGYERGSLWWRLHRIVEETAKRPAARAPHVRRLFDPLESDHMQTITELLNSTSEKDFEPNWNRLIKDHIEQIMTAVGHLEHEWQLE